MRTTVCADAVWVSRIIPPVAAGVREWRAENAWGRAGVDARGRTAGGPPPVTLASHMRAAVLGIFGNEDENPSPADVDDYEAALREAGVRHEFHRYDGAGHGFQDFTNEERYREAASEDAWQRALAFLHRELGTATEASA